MKAHFRLAIVSFLTVMLVAQSVMPGVLADTATVEIQAEATEVVIPTEAPVETPAPNTDIEAPTEAPQPTEPPIDELPAVIEPTLVWLDELKQTTAATCELAPTLDLAPLKALPSIQDAFIESGMVEPAGSVVVKVLFVTDHILDLNASSHWQAQDGGMSASTTVYFDAAPGEDVCDPKPTATEIPATDAAEEATADPDASQAEVTLTAPAVASTTCDTEDLVTLTNVVDGTVIISEAIHGDVVAGNTVNVIVTFAEGFTLDSTVSEGWNLQEDGIAIFAVAIPACEIDESTDVAPAAINTSTSGISSAVVTPAALPNVGDPVRIDMGWIANGSPLLSEGDSITFTIHNYELLGIGAITTDDPIMLEGCGVDGTSCGIVIIDASGNGTIILNANVEGAQSASGTFWIQTEPEWAADLQEDEDVEIDLDVTSGENTYDLSVTIPVVPFVPTPTPEPTPVPGTKPYKSGRFTSRDQGRTNPEGAIRWEMRAPTGPSAGAILTDTIAADAGFVFDCETVTRVNDWDANGQISIVVDCTETSITVTISAYLQSDRNNTPGISVLANVVDPAIIVDPADGNYTFNNQVASTNKDWDGQPFSEGSADATLTQNGSGPGVGDVANPRKSGKFTDSKDQGRENPVESIEWTVRAPAGPADGVVLVDEAEAGWEFVCPPTLLNGNWAGGQAASSEIVSCSPQQVEVSFGAYREFDGGQAPGFRILATRTADQPDNERGVLTFPNTVTSYTTPWSSEEGAAPIEGSATTQITQAVPALPKTDGSKTGRATRRDNGQYNLLGALEWTITLPAGPNGEVILTDTADVDGAGQQQWEFDCSTLVHIGGPAAAAGDIDCSPTELIVHYPSGYTEGAPVYSVRVNLLVPFEEGQVFENNASVRVKDYLNDPDWSEDGTNTGGASGSWTQNRTQGGTGQIGEFKVSVGDYVWLDLNRDGLQTAGEPAVPGVTVILRDSAGAEVTRTTTDANGYYWFTDLDSDGQYSLEFIEPAEFNGQPLGGWTTQGGGDENITDNPSAWNGADSNVNSAGIVNFTAPTMGANLPGAGATDNPTLDAGLVMPLVSIGDYIWFDYNRDGMQGDPAIETPVTNVSVTITGPDNFTASTTTDAEGYYHFADLEPNTQYTLTFGIPEGYDGWTTRDAAGVDDAADSDVDPAGQVSFTSPANGSNETGPDATDNPTLDAGLVRLVSIGDYAWYDENLDGQQGDPAIEAPVAGLTVTISGPDGFERSTQTDDSGYYFFDNLQPNTEYSLVFDKPEGFEWTVQNTGDDASDSDVDTNGVITFTSPAYGANRTGPNETDKPTLDAGLIRLVSIGDYVWFDYDRDGAQGTHELEEPVAGVVVTLHDAEGGVIGDTTTDENGFYSFNNLLPDTAYYLVFEQPDGFDGWTLQNAGDDDTADSDVDAAGRIDFASPATGANDLEAPDNPTLDAGLVVSHVSVGDFVWFDTNLDGQQDEDELPAAGIRVVLLDSSGAVVNETETDDAGYYWFTDLTLLAEYTLEFDRPNNWAWTAQNAGDDTSDSDVDADGRVTFIANEFGYNLPSEDENGALITDNPTLDAGLVPLVSIGDYVWFDYDRDGVQGTHELEEPVTGVTVTLYDADGGEVASTITDENGFYSFNNLYPNSEYTLQFGQPERFDGWTLQNAWEDDGSDSDVDAEGQVTFTSPSSGANSLQTPDDPTLDAGLIISRVSIGDYVWWDQNRDGVQDADEIPVSGVAVTLYDDGGEVVGTTTTDENGYYAFPDLQPGTEYTVEFEKPDGFAGWTSQDAGEDDSADSDVDASGRVAVTTPEFGRNLVGRNEADDPTIDAGLIRLVSIGDYVWYDANRDGVQDANEVPVAGVAVTLYDDSGEVVGTTTTDENGYYYFQNLLPEASYMLVFERPADYTAWTSQDQGDNDAADSDVTDAGVISFTSPVTGNNLIGPNEADNPTLDAGLVRLVSVGDYVWYDSDKDGIQDSDEKPAAGITVNLYLGEEIVASTVTDRNGYYYFQNLLPNTGYTLVFEKPEGFDWTTQNAGDVASDSDVDQLGIVRFTTPAIGSNLIGPDATDNPTLDAGLIEIDVVTPEPVDPVTPVPTEPATPVPTDPATPSPTDSATPPSAPSVTGLPSTGTGATSVALNIALVITAAMILAGVGFRMNATKRS